MPDRVDTTVKPVEPPRLHPSAHFGPIDASLSQLRDGHDPVLTSRDRRHSSFGRGTFLPHTGSKAPRRPDSPPSGPLERPMGGI